MKLWAERRECVLAFGRKTHQQAGLLDVKPFSAHTHKCADARKRVDIPTSPFNFLTVPYTPQRLALPRAPFASARASDTAPFSNAGGAHPTRRPAPADGMTSNAAPRLPERRQQRSSKPKNAASPAVGVQQQQLPQVRCVVCGSARVCFSRPRRGQRVDCLQTPLGRATRNTATHTKKQNTNNRPGPTATPALPPPTPQRCCSACRF